MFFEKILKKFIEEIINKKMAVLETNIKKAYLMDMANQIHKSEIILHSKFEKYLEGLKETAYLLRHPANAARLRESIKQAEEGKLEKHDLIEEKREDRG